MTRGSSWLVLGALSAGLLFSPPGLACTAVPGSSANADEQSSPAATEAALRDLDEQIARVREELGVQRSNTIAFLAAPNEANTAPLSENAEFRSLAELVARLALELDALEERRSALQFGRPSGPLAP